MNKTEEDPSSTLAYSQPRNPDQVEESDTLSSTDTERPPLTRSKTAIHGKDAQGRYIISWAENDPENPHNWPYARKMVTVGTISLMAFLTPLCSSIFAPGLPYVQRDFETDATTASLSISIFVIAFGVGPLVLAPLSETIGRKWVYNVCYPLFTVFQVGCALSTSIGMLIGFRFVAGLLGSAGIALGGGTIADMFDAKQRAKVVGKYVLGILIGPVVGPIAGGFLTEKLSWRWTFWLMTIIAAINSIVGLLFLRETYAPVLLHQRAVRMSVELQAPTIAADHDSRTLKRRLWQAVKRPLKILFLQPIVLVLASYMALLYGTMYLLFTTFPSVWRDLYGFNAGESGLTYIGLGLGFLISVVFGIPQIDKTYNKLAKRNGQGRPEYRMPIANIGAVLVPVGLFWYAWSLGRTHWIVPILGTLLFGSGMILVFNSIQNYFIDAFTRYAASAIAAGSLFRAVVGAVFPLFAPALYGRLGYSWGTSLLGFIAVLLMPLPILIMKYGERLRLRFPINLD